MSGRGYIPKDEIQFKGESLTLLRKAANEVQFLLDQGYDIKPTTTFVGNHYMFSERQRLALARCVSSQTWIEKRMSKELLKKGTKNLPEKVYIDGFNTIITLEVALSGSPIFCCRDGAIRDLAGLRGTYRIIDKTKIAIDLILQQLEFLKIKRAVFYLDAPVSNSGRLSTLIKECSEFYNVFVEVEIIADVDRTLEKLNGVISGDAIILNHCVSWINLIPEIINQSHSIWKIEL